MNANIEIPTTRPASMVDAIEEAREAELVIAMMVAADAARRAKAQAVVDADRPRREAARKGC